VTGVQTCALPISVSKFQAEEALRSSQEQLQAIIDGAPDTVVCLKDLDGRFITVNSRFEELLGITRDEVRGKTDYDIITRDRVDYYRDHDQLVLETGQPIQIEEVALLADGKEHTFLANKFPLVDASGKRYAVCAISVDITERKQTEQALIRSEKMAFEHKQLQALAERLQRAREEERKMVARDLHDDIGQILTTIKMDMAWAVRHLPKSEDEVHERLAGSIEMINDGVQSVRRICSGLRPGILDDLGLAAAIEWQAKEFASRTGIPCQVSVPLSELRLDTDRATAFFRIFQECLTNVARHAEAHSVCSSLNQQDESLMLVVEDDGKGFRESEVAGSLGVLGMKERAQVFGGSVQVSSSPGKGTKITVQIPVQPQAPDGMTMNIQIADGYKSAR
jgi:PAS domain S-box-containing protein